MVIQVLKQVFGFPSSPHTPAADENFEERLNEVEKKMVSLSEQLVKLSQVRTLDSEAIMLALKLTEKIIQNI